MTRRPLGARVGARHPASARRALLAAVGLLGVGLPLAATPARARQETDPTAPDRLTIIEQTPWVAPDGTFVLTLGIADRTSDETVTASVRDRVLNRTRFLGTLQGEGLRSELLSANATIDGQRATVTMAGDDLPREGVYPVIVDLVDGDGEVVDRLVTHLVRLDDPDPEAFPLGVAVVIPVHARPAHTSPGEIDVAAFDPLAVTVDALAAHPALPITVVPTPETVDGLAATNGARAAELNRAIQGSQTIAGTWVRIDPGSWARAGLSTGAQERAGAAALVAALGGPGDSSTWIAPAGVTRASVAAAASDLGAESVVVDDRDLEPLDAGDFPITLTRPFRLAVDDDSDTVEALAADGTLAAHQDETDDPVLAAHHTLADLAVLALDDPAERRVAVLRLDTDAASDADYVAALLTGLEPPAAPATATAPTTTTPTTSVDPAATTTTTAPPPPPAAPAPLVVAETLDSAFATVDPAGANGGADPDDPLVRSLLDIGPAPSIGSLPAQLRDADAYLLSYRTVFGPADPVAESVEVVVLTAGSGDLAAEERRAMLASGDATLGRELSGITGPPNQRVTLTDRTGVVQLVFGNATGRPADVTLRVRSDRIELPDHPDGVVPVHLADATTRVDLRVRARTSGDAPLDLLLTSPDGRIELGQSRVTVRTTAVSGVGLVLMGTAAGFLVLWWSRTIVRERRARRHRPAHARNAVAE